MSKVKKKEMVLQRCILSIDVGVKNLALCLLGGYSDKSVQIHYWKCIDVLSDSMQTTVVKEKKARRTKEEMQILRDNVGTCVSIIKRTGKPCGLGGQKNTRGRAYCGKHDPSKRHTQDDTQNWCFQMLKWLPELSQDILKVVDEICPNRDIFQVMIEQQSMDNKKMLLQSHLIYGHFVETLNNTVSVKFVPAYNKLSVYNGPEIICILKTPYARRKYLAKKHTEYFLENEKGLEKWKDYFENYKKKQDDLSDSMLQGLYFIKSIRRQKTENTKTKRRKRKVRF